MFHNNKSQYQKLVHYIMAFWQDVSPRWKLCREKIALNFDMPDSRFLAWDIFGRDFSWKYLASELLWYLSWDLHTHQISRYAKLWWQISDQNETVNSNYGYIVLHKRLWNWKTQYEFVLDTLKNDRDSRQAVIRYNDHDHAYEWNKDFPCTLTNQFFIRNWELEMIVNMRSNDMFYGFPYDFVWFWLLNQSLALDLWVKPWMIHWISWSAHIYEPMFEKANAIIKAAKQWDDDLAVYSFDLRISLNELKFMAHKQNAFLWEELDSCNGEYIDFIEKYFAIIIDSHGK